MFRVLHLYKNPAHHIDISWLFTDSYSSALSRVTPRTVYHQHVCLSSTATTTKHFPSRGSMVSEQVSLSKYKKSELVLYCNSLARIFRGADYKWILSNGLYKLLTIAVMYVIYPQTGVLFESLFFYYHRRKCARVATW